VSLAPKDPVGPFALVGRASEDWDRCLSVLHGLGFYKGEVDVQIGGRQLDDATLLDYLAGLPAKPPVPVTVAIRQGPLFRLGKVAIEGAVPAQVRAKLDLRSEAPAVAANVLAARERLLKALWDEGYALAVSGQPLAILEEDANLLDVTFKVDAGPRVDIGPIAFEGLERVNESFVRERLRVHSGERYDPKAIEKARQDLASLGVFSSVIAVGAEQVDAEGRLPLTFVVRERKRHAVSLSAAYAADQGASFSTTCQDRNLLSNAEQLKLSIGFSAAGTAQTGPGYWGSLQFLKPDFLQRGQNLRSRAGLDRGYYRGQGTGRPHQAPEARRDGGNQPRLRDRH